MIKKLYAFEISGATGIATDCIGFPTIKTKGRDILFIEKSVFSAGYLQA